jgi:hypothetical protein
MSPDGRLRLARILLTLTALEFFGPILRDFGPSHAFHPDWVGHARVHLVWLLGFMGLSGVVNLWLIWLRQPFDLRDLWLSVVWQTCNLGGFWIAYVLAPIYGGQIFVPGVHEHIFGYDENVFAFSIFSIILASGALVLLGLDTKEGAHAAA